MVKAQIHAGGRGKGSVATNPKQRGVQLVKTAAQAKEVASALLGQPLVTIQTGPAGQVVRQVLIEEGCDIARELYLGIVVDRGAGGPVLMVSSEGGMDIEDVAAHTPEKIFREPFQPDAGLHSFQVRKLAAKLGLTGAAAKAADAFMKGLCRVFVERDCSLVEINPLVVTGAGELIALDAKMTFETTTPCSVTKTRSNFATSPKKSPPRCAPLRPALSYVKLDGNIGCLVNGAGLAMSTMDLIKLHGGEPANFLDVGGGANVAQVTGSVPHSALR